MCNAAIFSGKHLSHKCLRWSHLFVNTINQAGAAYWSKYIIFSSLQSLITHHQSIRPAYILLNVCLPCLLLQDNFGAFNKQGPTNSKYFHFSLRKFTNFVEIFWKQSRVLCVWVCLRERSRARPRSCHPSLAFLVSMILKTEGVAYYKVCKYVLITEVFLTQR